MENEEGETKNQNFINHDTLEAIFKIMAITRCIHRTFLATRTRISLQTIWSKRNALDLYL
jgi:hypothetical protein